MHSNNILITFSLLIFSPLLVISQPRNSAQHLSKFLRRSNSNINAGGKLQKRYHKLSANLVQREYIGPLAIIKCLTDFTWALCASIDSCIDMGPVASGTKCFENKMIWNGQGDLGTWTGKTSDSVDPVASPSVSSPPAAPIESSSDTKLIVSSTPNQSITPTPSQTSNSDNTSSSNNDDTSEEDDGDCQVDSTGTTTDTFTPVVSTSDVVSSTTVESWSDAASPTTVVDSWSSDTVVLSTSTDNSPAATVKLIAIKPTPIAATGGGTSSNGPFTDGVATFFTQDGGYGACGKKHADSDYIVALQIDRYGTGSNSAPDCGRSVKITNTSNGKTIIAVVSDACPGCENYNSLDLSTGAFNALADPDTGVIPISWSFI